MSNWQDFKFQVQYIEQIDMLLNVRPGVGNDKLKNAYKSEGIYLFKKS